MAENANQNRALETPLYQLIEQTWIDYDARFTSVSVTEAEVLRYVLWCLEGLKDNTGDPERHAQKMRALLLRQLRVQYKQIGGDELNLLTDVIMAYVMECLDWAQTYAWEAFMQLYNAVQYAIPAANAATIAQDKAKLNQKAFQSELGQQLKAWIGHYLPSDVFYTDADAQWEVPGPSVAPQPHSPQPPKPRELMTLRMGEGLLPAHLQLLYDALIREGWIGGNFPDFCLLFSGRLQDFTLVWKGAFGQSTLVYLFGRLVEGGFVQVPAGFTLTEILDGHFVDANGSRLKSLSKGATPAAKAMPYVDAFVKLLQTNPSVQDPDDYSGPDQSGVYDPFDRGLRRR